MNAQPFVLVDVFTDTPLTGNPLAVFPEAEGLDDVTMHALAREFNFSETTFVVSPRDPRATRRLRSLLLLPGDVGERLRRARARLLPGDRHCGRPRHWQRGRTAWRPPGRARTCIT
jgi:Phenazine biosynthesis-like protein